MNAKIWITAVIPIFILILVACTSNQRESAGAESSGVQVLASGTVVPPTPKPIQVDLPDRGVAPEILNETWINSESPVTLESVRGKVVLLEFWTFGCINCRHVIPYVRDWYDKYNGDDFTVISVHYPEFNYERDIDNVKKATEELGIEYAVAIDNDRLTWGAYNQRYWPTTYLIDKSGRIRYQHIGEGAYEKTETAIQLLMAEEEPVVSGQ
jgi:thiol-disulfide isomerase/thioredoxin